MTRFEGEIKGLFGEYWQKSAQRDVDTRIAEYNEGKLLIDENGVARWDIGRVVPEDIAQMARFGGLPVDVEATNEVRGVELEKTIKAYRESQESREIDPEELFEMRVAFGVGTVVVDVITGREVRL